MACITKRRGRWVIDFYDQFGKRRWETLPKDATKKKAKERLRVIEEQVSRRTYLPGKKIPLFSEVSKEWLGFKKPKIRMNTWTEYQRQVRIHFSELDNLRIDRITIATVEKYITARQNQEMNISTLRRILVVLNQIMNYAVRHGYIGHNPVREAERPRGKGNGTENTVKIKVLTPDQINAFLNATIDQEYRTLFRLAIFSGARQGEIIGLKWTDIDWKISQIHIQRTFNHGKFFSPKSKASDRKIDIGPAMMMELKKWKLACPSNDLNLVFPNKAGKPIDHHQMIPRYFTPALEKAKVPRVRFHDLRHTFASLLIEQGENIKYIQSQLGHSNPTVTLNVYAHLMKPANQEAACRLEKAIFETTGSKMVAKTE